MRIETLGADIIRLYQLHNVGHRRQMWVVKLFGIIPFLTIEKRKHKKQVAIIVMRVGEQRKRS